MAHADLQPGLGGELGQLGLPQSGPVAVGAAAVGADQQPSRVRVGVLADGVPPAADGLNGELRGVVVGAHVDPAGVGRHVVDAVRDGLAEVLVGEVVHVDLLGLAAGPPFPATVLVPPDQLLLLGVHADHRAARGHVLLRLRVEVAELGVPVRVLLALDRLGVALQAVPQLTGQQGGHGRGRHLMSPPGQRLGQVPGRLGRPFQRRHRIAPGLRLHQRLQCLKQTRIGLDQRPASRPRPADPAVLRLGRLDFPPATGHRVRVRPGRLGDPLGPASAQGHSLGPQHQPPRLLIQVRPHQLVPARYILISHTSHIAQTKPPPHHETQLIDQRALTPRQARQVAPG